LKQLEDKDPATNTLQLTKVSIRNLNIGNNSANQLDKNYVYPEGEITGRWASCYDLQPPTLMITTNPIVDLSLGSEIQICPWFLTQSRDWKISDLKSLNKVVWGGLAEIVMPAVTKVQYTPIDAFSLFEKVALHEVYLSGLLGYKNYR
jgi:hypothetical protein